MSKRDLYYKMMKLIEQEEEVVKRVRKAEDEVNLIFLLNMFIIQLNVCRFRYVIFKHVVNKKNFQVIFKLVFMIPIETKNQKYIENYW